MPYNHLLLEQRIMTDPRWDKLIALGTDKLVSSLLKAAAANQEIDDFVTRLSSSKSENLKRYYERLEKLRKCERFYEWRERNVFIRQLENLIQLLEYGASSPQEGICGIFALFETDSAVYESCHDDGEIYLFYQMDVCELFARFARDCDDKDWLKNEIIRICQVDGYGCRSLLYEYASTLLFER